jgi:hypothetical protein
MAVEMAGMLDRKVGEGSKNGYVNNRKVRDASRNGWDAR